MQTQRPSYRPVAMGRRGIVSSGHALATLAGLKILEEGGNAVDAAVTVSAVLGVTQPGMCGIGGDLFALIYSKSTGQVEFLNASGRSPNAYDLSYFKAQGVEEMPARGALTVTVPGCVSGWEQMLKRYGTLELEKLLTPAIHYAENGFPLSQIICEMIKRSEDQIASPAVEKIFGSVKELKPGKIIYQKDLGKTMRLIAEQGPEVFYYGPIAEAMINEVNRGRGKMTLRDFTDHRADWGQPIKVKYHDYEIYNTPPNTQGLAALLAFNIVEDYPLATMEWPSPQRLVLLTEAVKAGAAVRDQYISDPDFIDIPLEKLLSKEFAGKLREEIKQKGKLAKPVRSLEGDTSYFSVVDHEGNIVSCVQSLYYFFGSSVVVDGTGIILQNRGSYFSLRPDDINKIEPHKRTMHTLTASIVFKAGKPYIVFGTMGGEGQPQTHLQVITNIIEHRMDIQAAIEAPRFVFGSTLGDDGAGVLHLEARFPQETVESIVNAGYLVKVVEPLCQEMGHAHGVMIEEGVFYGGADPRGDGCALALD